MGATASADVAVARASDWAPYVAAAGIVNPGDNDAVVQFVADALQSTPLPSPWTITTDAHGQRLFTNLQTAESTWRHPLEEELKSLVGLYKRCVSLKRELREPMLTGLHQKFESDANAEYAKWRSVTSRDGGRYYFNTETQETTWEHPAAVFLPGHYMRIRSIERLRDQDYMSTLGCRASILCSSCNLDREMDKGPVSSECRLTLKASEATWVRPTPETTWVTLV